ncbi:MAG: glycosyltransferase family 4 protein [Verrucomicrobiota bacterium]
MLVVSHPTGNEFVRALLYEAAKRAVLLKFFTTLATAKSDCLWPARVGRRRAYALPKSILETRPMRESVRLLATSMGFTWLTRHECGWASVDAVYRDLDAHMATWLTSLGKAKFSGAVHAYEDGALATFQAARQQGLRCSYELPIVYWETSRRLLAEEALRYPEWEPTLVGTRDSAAKLERKTREIDLADVVVCPSAFVARSVPERHSKKCVVAEFGSPEVPSASIASHSRNRPFRLLFAGSMTQRKGLADLFAAMRLLKRKDIILVVFGAPLAPHEFYRRQYPDFIYEPPRAHAEVLTLMGSCDALVLPSIVEGRALVQQEAMQCGLPLVVTANAGGEDLIEAGRTGFLVPIRSPEALAEKIAWFADHRADLFEMGLLARQKSAQYTWPAYAQKILSHALIVEDCGADH